MFYAKRIPSNPVRIGLDWAVIKRNFDGTESTIAYCADRHRAGGIVNTLNEFAKVAV